MLKTIKYWWYCHKIETDSFDSKKHLSNIIGIRTMVRVKNNIFMKVTYYPNDFGLTETEVITMQRKLAKEWIKNELGNKQQ